MQLDSNVVYVHVYLKKAVLRHGQFTQASWFSTTQALEKKKKIVFPKHNLPIHGSAFRLATGQSVTGERYGPLVDKPDYTYLDGRPTPLTPEQIELREERKRIAASVVNGIKELTEIKTYNQNRWKLLEAEQQKIQARKLKPKS